MNDILLLGLKNVIKCVGTLHAGESDRGTRLGHPLLEVCSDLFGFFQSFGNFGTKRFVNFF